MNDTYTTQLGPWEEYADEHILLLRKFSGEESIPVEFVHVIRTQMTRAECSSPTA